MVCLAMIRSDLACSALLSTLVCSAMTCYVVCSAMAYSLVCAGLLCSAMACSQLLCSTLPWAVLYSEHSRFDKSKLPEVVVKRHQGDVGRGVGCGEKQ